ncbi:hypothetical protein P4O66_008450 [Electrophorus voltai]|uniref:snRNA-activating protein complex subunit 2 n=1 Tax=Electrophorus voltai TaxID=2609070 RepID=A0AAD8ZDI0_9TELE|nr:hypothetical protein P4O66_008450 [Electrophorus voltai]
MKPPSRQRILPLRFRSLKRAEPNHKFSKLWYLYELRSLLRGLQQQKMNSNLNLTELRKKLPKRSLLEIQNQIRSLRTRVVKRVHLQVQKQRREEQKAKAPIQIWAELAQKMAGIHEETISSAFSQMLVIAATEPCSLGHSDPPRTTDTPVDSNLHTKPRTHMFRSWPASGLPSTPPPVTLPDRNSATPVQSPGTPVVLRPSAQDSTLSPLVLTSVFSVEHNYSSTQLGSGAGQESAVPSTPCTPKSHPSEPTSSPIVSTPAPLTPTTSALSTAAVSRGQFRQHQKPISDENKCVVDFEKIYQIMSNINKSHNYNLPLSAMECAVLLDLLMSLPEELPLLDCRELQHHLLQVQKRLTMAAVMPLSFPSTDQPAVTEPVSDKVTEKQSTASHQNVECTDSSLQIPLQDLQLEDDSGVVREQDKASSDTFSPSSVVRSPAEEADWEAVGLCPLNPFMVPVALLKRREST